MRSILPSKLNLQRKLLKIRKFSLQFMALAAAAAVLMIEQLSTPSHIIAPPMNKREGERGTERG